MQEKLKELRMTLIILVLGIFFMSGCLFNDKVTVTFKTNGGSDVENITLSSGNKLTEPDNPTKDGYVFDGWYLDGEEFDFDTSIDENITLVAKWTKLTIEDEEETTTTTETTSTSKTTTKKTTTKKTTTTTSTVKKLSNTTTTTKTTKKTVETTTTTTTTTTNIVPVVTVPTIVTTEITTTTEPTTKINYASLNITKEDILDENEEKTNEKIIISKITKEETNVISNIDSTDLLKLEESDITKWNIISNHNYEYILDFTNIEDTTKINSIELLGDMDVLSFSVSINGETYIFDYDEVLNIWYIKYPTVSIGIGLDLHYFADLSTAINVIKSKDTLNILSDQAISTELKINYPITINGNNYKITNESGYLFNIEDIIYEDTDELTINDIILDVDSLIYIGESKFNNITFYNLTGTIKTNKTDIKANITFNNSNLLSNLTESIA